MLYKVSSSSENLSTFDMIAIFFSFLFVTFFMFLIKKIYLNLSKKKRYSIIPKANIRIISSVSMTISLSVVIIIIVSVVSSNFAAVLFRAFPGTRITIEAVLIKIGGLLFGPFIGIFIGGVTDLLTIAMTAGIFHYGYFIAAISFGLIGGLINLLVKCCYQRKNLFLLLTIFSMALTCIFVGIFIIYSFPEGHQLVINFIVEIKLHPWELSLFIWLTCLAFILLILLFYFLSVFKKDSWFAREFFTFSTIVLLCFITEIFVNVFMLPVFDKDLSTLNYSQWLAIRGVLAIPLIAVNTFIIWPVYKIIKPMIKGDISSEEKSKNEKIIKIYI